MSISEFKAVLPVAGLGTRMLPATKEQPKEMLPVFAKTRNGELCVKPLLQLIFEQLYENGAREFIFVVGRGKRTVEDHFTPDYTYLEMLRGSKPSLADDLERFYNMINTSMITWINQPQPLGFGHAVLITQPLIGDDSFIVHAGDTYIMPDSFMQRMVRIFKEEKADAVLLLQEVENPRQYGVAEVSEYDERVYHVKEVVEKPQEPRSNLAIMPVYVFRHELFNALRETPKGVGGEIQLTDGIQRLIQQGRRVYAIKLENEVRLDIGTPTQYWYALVNSYRWVNMG